VTGQKPINGICPVCHGRLLWATTVHGHQVPLDATPDPAGNQLLDRGSHRLGAVQLTAAEATAIRQSDSPDRLYQTHFASHPTCAQLRTRTRKPTCRRRRARH